LTFIEVRETPDERYYQLPELRRPAPTLIGLAGYESPSVLQNLIDLKSIVFLAEARSTLWCACSIIRCSKKLAAKEK